MKIIMEQITKTYEDIKKTPVGIMAKSGEEKYPDEHIYDDTEDEVRVLEDFSLTIEKGEFVILTGESGIGKTTLLKLLLREIRPEYGKIKVGEYHLETMRESEIPFYRRKLGVIFQDLRLVEDMTVYDNICLAREVVGGSKKDSRKIITSICSSLGIADLHRRYPNQLSGGQKQKVCLARALVNYPDLILADEPTGNLSATESCEIMELFHMIHRQGITIVMATHDKQSLGEIPYREIILEGIGSKA